MSRTKPSRFGYHAIILPEDVYDGDSCTADIDLGLGVWLHRQKLRLLGVDTAELRGASKAAGVAARDFVRDLLPEDGVVLLRTHKGRRKKGKYGRWLIEIWIERSPQQLVCVNDELLRAGHAVRYLD
jgi:micrococcal nuclease